MDIINNEKAFFQSKLQGDRKTSKKICKLACKRNNKINDYLHKASRELVNQLVSKKRHYLNNRKKR